MIFESKYSLGQKVYGVVVNKKSTYIPVECNLCDDTGEVEIKEKDVKCVCPECFGDKVFKSLGEEMTISKIGIIGKISIEQYDSKYEKRSGVKYMLDVTGVGSGTIWWEDDLYSSEEEAKAACKEFNSKNLLL